MCGEICNDNRFEIIAAYKKKLIDGTNIESRPEEMAVIDDILFRFWQMDWLPPIPHGRLIDADALCERLKKAMEFKPHLEGAFYAAISFTLTAPTIIEEEDGEA